MNLKKKKTVNMKCVKLCIVIDWVFENVYKNLEKK